MITAPRPSPRRFPRSARTAATVVLTLVRRHLPTRVRRRRRRAYALRAGGSGTPVALLHGWPQTWNGWWPLMPELAKHHTVYAVDLPGLGDSTGSPSGYDKATLTLARSVHTLIADRLGVDDDRVAQRSLLRLGGRRAE
ncbi:alpha/beta fold hydrolase [Streptomyces sp. NPDC127178]|uniref:alpha/beta fold hydrolase n=1 Tax=unclassified Streptomyces TaxID=2593676 RepID=UPI00363FE741